MENYADWLTFSDHQQPPRVLDTDPALNSAIDLRPALDASPAAAASWNRSAFKPFPDGTHLAVVTHASWRQGGSGTAYLFIVWREMGRKRGGFSQADPIFLNARTDGGRTFALRRLSFLASAAGITLDASAFKPSDLLGAVATLVIETQPHYRDVERTAPVISRYLPAPPI